jgi:hypothetical protein
MNEDTLNIVLLGCFGLVWLFTFSLLFICYLLVQVKIVDRTFDNMNIFVKTSMNSLFGGIITMNFVNKSIERLERLLNANNH